MILVTVTWEPFIDALEAAQHYVSFERADWAPTNVWLKSAECARATGAWLAICEPDNRLVPISEHALADDPGHAFFLGIWALVADRHITYVDVARLNITLNFLGLISLTVFLWAIGAHIASIAFLIVGSPVYLSWTGLSPHWSFIGVLSMAVLLPAATVAKEHRLFSVKLANFLLLVGLLGEAIAALVREAIGDMILVATLVALLVLAARRISQARGYRGQMVIACLVLAVSATPFMVKTARDAFFKVEPERLVARHGYSDILYKGLGAVPNSLGIAYDDAAGQTAVQRVDPGVEYCSPDFFRIIREIYFQTLLENPVEAARIYLEKTRVILDQRMLDWAPTLWVTLGAALFQLFVFMKLNVWRRIDFIQGLLIEVIAISIVGFFIVQAILASPDRFFAMPVGAAIVLITCVMLECIVRSAACALRPVSRIWMQHAIAGRGRNRQEADR